MKKGILAWLLILLSFVLGVLAFCGTTALACHILGVEITQEGGFATVIISFIVGFIMAGTMTGIIESKME